jgi:hypothetical protein
MFKRLDNKEINMSFNLKAYKKTLDNANIDKRLEDSRDKSIKVPEVLNEKQLESYRAKEKTALIQSLLEDKRTGEDTEVTEKRLDTHKPKFANKYRNPAAYEGDINKLEEKRLSNKPTEKIKYEAASTTPKKLRWWENVKSPDGLKVAKTVIAQTSEELSFDTPRWNEIGEEEGLAPEEKDPVAFVPEDIDEAKGSDDFIDMAGDKDKTMTVKKQIYQSNEGKDFPAFISMRFEFNPRSFKDEEEIKEAALEKAIEINPNLAGKISVDNFGGLKKGVDLAQITLRAVGDEFLPVINKTPSVVQELPVKYEEGADYQEVVYKQEEIDGTPMVFGTVKVNETVSETNKNQVIQGVLEFIKEKHPELEIERNSLDLADLEQGQVRFIVSAPIAEKTLAPSIDKWALELENKPTTLEEDFRKMEEPAPEPDIDPETAAELAEFEKNIAENPNYYDDFPVNDVTPEEPEEPEEEYVPKKNLVNPLPPSTASKKK